MMEASHTVTVDVLRGIEAQMRQLLQEEEYDSVVHLGSVFCPLTPTMSSKLSMQKQLHEMHALYAEALLQKREYRRALRYFSSSLSSKYPKMGKSTTMTHDEASLRFKLASCMFHLDDVHNALKMLEIVHPQARSLRMHMLLGKLNSIEGLTRKAEAAYMAALKYLHLFSSITIDRDRENPYALEATIALAELAGKNEECSPTNLDDCEIVHFYTRLGQAQQIRPADAAWMQHLVDGHIQLHAHHLEHALHSFESMERVVSRSLHCYLHRAKIHMDLEAVETAMSAFVQARQCDASNVTIMDSFALLLKQAGLTMQLNSLVRDLFAVTEARPEPWLAAAYYSDLKGDRATALQLCDRAVSIDPAFPRSYLCRGQILLALDRPEHAVTAFSNASKLEKSIEAYEGMVEGLCGICLKGLDKYMDAMNVARLALMFMPHSPRAFLLLGSVLALKPDSRDRARKAFEKALSMQPLSLRAHFGLVDLLIVEAKYDEAIERHAVNTPHQSDCLLGDVYTLHRLYGDALPQYHRALALNPNCAKALRGVDRVEKFLRGEDPENQQHMARHLDMDSSTDTLDSFRAPH
ncbi:Aste57867_21914 [Aphanomyces stellatus]|uniref:Aste57867_21914 protein n=1 Tax=Aphanomyces stellatus TaxID=120398 RepID=A0A485LIT4_9STRA|nr:hypothetical protein As57867_021845 [Aphanomyces stellatus]VFT98582.1 Aste57867_21914 [Aphanomyces stellatus]